MKLKYVALLMLVSIVTTVTVTLFAALLFPERMGILPTTSTPTSAMLEQPRPEAVPNPPTATATATPDWWALTESTEELDWDVLCKLYDPQPPADYPLPDRHAGEGVNGNLKRVDDLVFQIVLESVPSQPPLVSQLAEFSMDSFYINEDQIEEDNPGLQLSDSNIRVWVALSEHRNMEFVLTVSMSDGQIFEILLGDVPLFAAPCDLIFAESRTQTPAPPLGNRA